MKNKGWVKLYRQTLDNPIITKSMAHFVVWNVLLLKATSKPHKEVFNGEPIILQPGQLIIGRKQIAELFSDLSESKVQRILKTFEIEQQIEQQTCSKNRLITLKNWKRFQKSEQQIEQQLNNKRTTTEQQLNTYKNRKNRENSKNRENASASRTHARAEAAEAIKKLFENFCVSFPKPITSEIETALLNANINAQVDDVFLYKFECLFKRAEQSDFLSGRNGRANRRFTAGWIIQNAEKINSGVYDNKEPQTAKKPKSKSSNCSYDIEELMKIK